MIYTTVYRYNLKNFLFYRKTVVWFVLSNINLPSMSYMKKKTQIAKRYNHPRDLFVDIKNGNLDVVLNSENSYKDLIHAGVEVLSERITEKVDVQAD